MLKLAMSGSPLHSRLAQIYRLSIALNVVNDVPVILVFSFWVQDPDYLIM